MRRLQKLYGTLTILLVTITAKSFACSGDGRKGYPTEWFAEVPKSGAPDWEILPQEAGPCEVILSKRNELGILSNFAATPFDLDGARYASLEGLWQSLKYPENAADPRMSIPNFTWPMTRRDVTQLSGFAAKDAGGPGSEAMRRLGINWVTYLGQKLVYKTPEKGEHFKLIVRATWAKLKQNPDVERILLKTGDLTLKPDHKQEGDAPLAWKYFEIWMDIRTELRQRAENAH